MSQHDYSIANDTGAAVRADINNALAAIVTNNSGASAPSSTSSYMFWADTTTGLLKIRNAANSAWITVGTLASAFLGNMQTTGGAFSGATTYSNTDYTGIPVGTTAQRPVSPSNGYVRYNTDLKSMEIYEESVWINLGDRQPLATKTANYTILNSDTVILGDATSGAITLTLPTAVGIAGKKFTLKKVGSSTNAVNIATTSSQTIDGNTTDKLRGRYGYMEVMSDGANYIILGVQDKVAFTASLTVSSGGGSVSNDFHYWMRNGLMRTLVSYFDYSGMSGTVYVTYPLSSVPDGGPTSNANASGCVRRTNTNGTAGTMGKFSTDIQIGASSTEAGAAGGLVGTMNYFV